jgi:hypothetical protein
MGTMSASDAAPLPRLGEVFFDVRGNSRSMRLSWYADTGVAVLSIWQGGMCTGTFRLAIADLPRMVETLQRGPGGQPAWDGQAPGQAFGDAPGDATAQVGAMGPMSGQMMQPGPADFPAGPPDYLAEAGPRTGISEYPAASMGSRGGSGQYPAASPTPAPGSRQGPPGYPAEPPQQPQERRGGTPDYLADPLEALGQLGVPEAAGPPSVPYQTGGREYPAEQPPDARPRPADYLTGPPPDDRPRPPADYLTGPPPDERPAPGGYRSGPAPEQHAGPADYLTGPMPDHQAGPADYVASPPPERHQPADYLTGPMPDERPPDYLTGPPPGQQAPPADYPSGPSSYPPGPPQQRTEYLTDLPGAPNTGHAGYGGDFHPGAGQAGSYPGAGDSGAYPQGTGRQGAYQGGPASDPYLATTGSMDYQGEPPVSHYQRGSSAPRSAPRSARRSAPRSASHEDSLGPTTADYPVHYGTAVTDDMGDEPPVESFPYQPRRGGR